MTVVHRRSELVRGIGALLVLTLTVVGVPLLLVGLVGWPLPTEVPTPDDLTRLLTRGDVTSATLIKAFSIAVWLAWLQVTMTTIAEASAVVRGRRALRMPGPPGLRRLVVNLVASATLLLSGPVRPALAVPSHSDDLNAVLADPEDPSNTLAPAGLTDDVSPQTELPSRASDPAGGAEQPFWTVGPSDTLWDIAERTLGDGLRWKEIHQLNIGHRQPDGGALQPDDDLIRPGWVLTLPSDARIPESADGPSERETTDVPAQPAGLVTVDPDDTLWDLSEEHLEDPFRWPQIFEANEGRPQADGRTLTDPDLIHPGWVLRMPSPEDPEMRPAEEDGAGDEQSQPQGITEPPGAEPVGPAPAPEDVASVADVGGVGGDRHIPDSANGGGNPVSDTHGRDRAPTASDDGEADRLPLVLGGGILAAGMIATLERIRRARRRRRPVGRRIHVPEGDQAAAEEHLCKLADLDTAEFLGRAIASLSGLETSHGDRVLDRIALVSTSPTELTVHLTAPQPSPADGWRAEDHGMTWVLESPEPEVLDGALTDPEERPFLVSVGTTADGTRRVQLNLRCVRTLAVTGDHDAQRTALLSFAAELATSTVAPHVRVVLAGVGGTIAALERVEFIPETQEVVELLERRVGEVRSTSDRRDLQPLVALFGVPMSPSALDRIRSLVESCEGTAVAVLTAFGTSDDGWVMTRTDDGWHLTPVGLDLNPIELDQHHIDQFGELVLQAKNRLPTAPDDEPEEHEPATEDAPDVYDVDEGQATERDSDEVERADVIDLTDRTEERPVEVKVLGSVHVAGVERWPSAKSKELVIYLAVHPRGTHMDTLMEALWPNEEPNRNRLQTEVSRARRTLGEASDGRSYLPPVEHDIYRLHPSLGTDYDRFEELVRRADREPGSAQQLLEEALSLVEGEPFTECSDYWWIGLDAHTVAAEVADAAHRVCALYLEQDRPAEAAKAARKGLKADPLFEVLRRDLMRAEAALGNTAEIHAIMSAFRQAMSEEGEANDADDLMDPETVQLYEQLASRATARSPRTGAQTHVGGGLR